MKNRKEDVNSSRYNQEKNEPRYTDKELEIQRRKDEIKKSKQEYSYDYSRDAMFDLFDVFKFF